MKWTVKLGLLYFILHVKLNETYGKKGYGPGEQDWGYVEVRPEAHMFWWLFYANPPSKSIETPASDRPLLIWLQGGPGLSTTGYVYFQEIGPIDINLKPRDLVLMSDYNVVLIDNPVGVGFSYVKSNTSYVTSTSQIADDLLVLIKEFYIIHPEFKNTPTYIVGESYGGRMGIALADVWFKAQTSDSIDSNLQGVLLLNSWISPIDTIRAAANYALNTGTIDNQMFNNFTTTADEVIAANMKKDWMKASKLWALYANTLINQTNADFSNMMTKKKPCRNTTRLYYTYNFENNDNKNNNLTFDDKMEKLQEIMNNDVKNALHFQQSNHTWESYSEIVNEYLRNDIMRPCTDIVEKLLNETTLKVYVANGQLDAFVSSLGTLRWIENLNWRYIEDWKQSERVPFSVDDIVEGYVKQYKKLRMYWINRSGHIVPHDNPQATFALLQDLTATE